MSSPSVTRDAPSGSSKQDELWSGHSRFLAFWEAAVMVGLVICTLITVLTTLGIIIVLSAQSFEFFHLAKRQRARIPARDRAKA